ncbi:hypothetical protein ABAC460_05710 [Asticcacaulis sp. AC460]|nr:hypothetical protein ABAC460_05710 [Asticcacaulis sp. AC460]
MSLSIKVATFLSSPACGGGVEQASLLQAKRVETEGALQAPSFRFPLRFDARRPLGLLAQHLPRATGEDKHAGVSHAH